MPEQVLPPDRLIAQRRTLNQIDTAVDSLLDGQRGDYRSGVFRLEAGRIIPQRLLRIAQTRGARKRDRPAGKITQIEIHDGMAETARNDRVPFTGIRIHHRFSLLKDAVLEKGYYLKNTKILEDSHPLSESEATEVLAHFSQTNRSLRVDTSGRTQPERLRDINFDRSIRVDIHRLLQLAKEGNGLIESEVSDLAAYQKDTTSVLILKHKLGGLYNIVIKDKRDEYLDPTDSDLIVVPTLLFTVQPNMDRHSRIMCYQLLNTQDRDGRISQDSAGLRHPIEGKGYEDMIQILYRQLRDLRTIHLREVAPYNQRPF